MAAAIADTVPMAVSDKPADGGSTMMAENIVIVCNAMNMNRKWSIK
jgi:hypothetical protein